MYIILRLLLTSDIHVHISGSQTSADTTKNILSYMVKAKTIAKDQ